jgi:hypothetical protein
VTGFAAEARSLVDRLGALDHRRVVFGARRHDYGFGRTLTAAQVDDFERRHGVELPAPYRDYLIELGNGGAGPYYGINPLRPDEPQLSRPFPHTERVTDAGLDPLDGVVELAEYGCGIFMVLVVNGPARGQVWVDARSESGLGPEADSFDQWWLRRMGAPLQRFESIAELMEQGAGHDAIHEQLDGGSYTQLEIDEAMLSIMDADPEGAPTASRDKPWGRVCGLVDDVYSGWLASR